VHGSAERRARLSGSHGRSTRSVTGSKNRQEWCCFERSVSGSNRGAGSPNLKQQRRQAPLCESPEAYDLRMQVSKGARIRQGSPEEEAALAAHIGALAPTPAALAALGELSEALVVLGHADDARVLQAAMAALLAAQEVCPHCLPCDQLDTAADMLHMLSLSGRTRSHYIRQQHRWAWTCMDGGKRLKRHPGAGCRMLPPTYSSTPGRKTPPASAL